MWGVSRLQMHGICNHSLVNREVVEARLNYKKSYLCQFRNPDSTGSFWIEKYQVHVPTRLAWGKGGEGRCVCVCVYVCVCVCVCVERPVMTELMVVILMPWCRRFTYGEYGFRSMESWSYSRR